MGERRALCLNMIVKNEMANLERCLRSVAPYIDCWVIGDTGSTDGTQDFIRAFFAARGIPGEIHEFAFLDFAQARNEALALARASKLEFDYLLLTDADMELVVEDERFAERLDAAAYRVLQRSGVAYWNTRLVGRNVPSSYKGVTHEYLDIREGETLNLEGISYIDHATGSNRFEKYERDVRLLKGAIAAETDPGLIARYNFYLANTYRDAGQAEEAIAAYEERVRCGGWAEEVFVSQFNIARIKEEQGRPDDEVIAAYETAAATAPWRAEALHGAARFCRNHRLYKQGYEFARQGLTVAYPRDSLFVQDWVYDYGLRDELAVNAFWTGRYLECEAACDQLLAEGKLPADNCDRVARNRDLAIARRREAADAAGSERDPFVSLLRAARAKETAGAPLEDVLAAYDVASVANPARAEALHAAARLCRALSLNDRAREYADRGLAIPRPDNAPGLEAWIYDWGLLEELSIAANYSHDPAHKARGFAACNWLALSREVPEARRDLAGSNIHFYLQTASELMPSFAARAIAFDAPANYRATNPSITRVGNELVMVQRTVNYRVDPSFPHYDARRYATDDGSPINTRNFLLRLSEHDLSIRSSKEILPPDDWPAPVWPLVLGFEDLRPFAWRNGLWSIACVRERTDEGWCEMVLGRLDDLAGSEARLTDWRVLQPEGLRQHEKNWMPIVVGDDLRFVYSSDPTRVVDEQAKTLLETGSPIAAGDFRGGSQFVPFSGGWLAILHEMKERDGQRHYHHRFVWLDADMALRGVSRPFYFKARGIEFAAGLAWHPDGKRLVISYGVLDAEAWIATVDAGDVRAIIDDVQSLPKGVPGESSYDWLPSPIPDAPSAPLTTPETFQQLAPFLGAVEDPVARREASRGFDAKIAPWLDPDAAALPQIHGFYEVMDEAAKHEALIASASSMRRAGHPVKLWSYTPQKLEFLKAYGVELCDAADVVPRGMFEKVMAGSEIRYFSDVFRYAVLYEHGGLWMDSDVVMLRPFPFSGHYFFNLQWRPGARNEHFVCGNVMYARPYSRHMRALYEQALERRFGPEDWIFGEVGPKLLSDYIASGAGAELREWVFSPVFFNPIDWTETDKFDRPLAELGDYLNDDRVIGVHMWTARNNPNGRGADTLIAALSDPLERFPRFTDLADRFNTDKNRHTGNRHAYARVYDRLLAGRQLSMRRIMEIGLCRGLAEKNQSETPSVALWQGYFPYAQVVGLDLTDFSALNNSGFVSFVCDQSQPEQLRATAAQLEPGSFDVIIDDGSHASHDEQLTLRELFPLLADGGWFFLEDLDWQPPGEDPSQISLTKHLLREIAEHGKPCGSHDPFDIAGLASQFEEILFFDSHYELNRARLMGGLVAIRKRGGSGLVR